MREVVAGVHRIGIHGAQVLDLKLDQGFCQFGLVAKVLGECIGLKFIPAAENIHQKLDHQIHRSQCVREEDEADYDGGLSVEAEVLIQGTVVDED